MLGLWFLLPGGRLVSGCLGGSARCAGPPARTRLYRRGDAMGAVLLALLLIKLVYEQYSGAEPVRRRSSAVLPAAHCLGALGGLAGSRVLRTAAKSL